MNQEDKISAINQVVDSFFIANYDLDKIPAKDLVPNFISAGIFEKDHRKGLPIRDFLRDLDDKKQLNLIPTVLPERKKVNTNWFFVRKSS